jgi:hypothetical protein
MELTLQRPPQVFVMFTFLLVSDDEKRERNTIQPGKTRWVDSKESTGTNYAREREYK